MEVPSQSVVHDWKGEMSKLERMLAEQGASLLAEGWSAHTDASTNREYYYNASTKETSWERPVRGAGR
jgi:WW domain